MTFTLYIIVYHSISLFHIMRITRYITANTMTWYYVIAKPSTSSGTFHHDVHTSPNPRTQRTYFTTRYTAEFITYTGISYHKHKVRYDMMYLVYHLVSNETTYDMI